MFNTPEYKKKQAEDYAKINKNKADKYWAKAKNGEGDYNYKWAKEYYNRAEENRNEAAKWEKEIKKRGK